MEEPLKIKPESLKPSYQLLVPSLQASRKIRSDYVVQSGALRWWPAFQRSSHRPPPSWTPAWSHSSISPSYFSCCYTSGPTTSSAPAPAAENKPQPTTAAKVPEAEIPSVLKRKPLLTFASSCRHLWPLNLTGTLRPCQVLAWTSVPAPRPVSPVLVHHLTLLLAHMFTSPLQFLFLHHRNSSQWLWHRIVSGKPILGFTSDLLTAQTPSSLKFCAMVNISPRIFRMWFQPLFPNQLILILWYRRHCPVWVLWSWGLLPSRLSPWVLIGTLYSLWDFRTIWRLTAQSLLSLPSRGSCFHQNHIICRHWRTCV